MQFLIKSVWNLVFAMGFNDVGGAQIALGLAADTDEWWMLLVANSTEIVRSLTNQMWSMLLDTPSCK